MFRENDAFANEKDETKKAKKRKTYFAPIIEELKKGGSEALLGLLLQRDIRDFNAEAIPETHERRQQKLNSASPGDKLIMEFAQRCVLAGSYAKSAVDCAGAWRRATVALSTFKRRVCTM